MRHWLIPLFLLFVAAPALAESVQVDATGSGATREEAVTQGLIEAIQQVTGVALETVQEIRTAVASVSVNDTHTVALSEAQQGATRRTTNGLIRSYEVIDTETEAPGRVVVRLSVEVEKFRPLGVGISYPAACRGGELRWPAWYEANCGFAAGQNSPRK